MTDLAAITPVLTPAQIAARLRRPQGIATVVQVQSQGSTSFPSPVAAIALPAFSPAATLATYASGI